MTDDIERVKRGSIEQLKDYFEGHRNGKVRASKKPSDKAIVRAITATATPLTAFELQREADTTSADDYDEWIIDAVNARAKSRIQLDSTGTNIEHPTTRLFKIGIESIKAGKASPAFLAILTNIANEAEKRDVMHLVFPRAFPSNIDSRQMKSAEEQSWIVSEYIEFIRKNSGKDLSFSELKKQFKEHYMHSWDISEKKVDLALAAFDLNYQGKPGRKKKAKPKKTET